MCKTEETKNDAESKGDGGEDKDETSKVRIFFFFSGKTTLLFIKISVFQTLLSNRVYLVIFKDKNIDFVWQYLKLHNTSNTKMFKILIRILIRIIFPYFIRFLESLCESCVIFFFLVSKVHSSAILFY